MVTAVSLLMTLAAFTGVAGAADQHQRPVIAFFYVDDLAIRDVEKEMIKQETLARFAHEYDGAYEFRLGDSYSGVNRFTDLANLDRFDLLPQLRHDKVDYAVFYTLLPFQTKPTAFLQMVTTVSRVHVRVFDLQKNVYVSDANLSYRSKWAWPSGHCEKLFADADSKVFKGLFPAASVASAATTP